jgi:hypothetical protein
MSSRHSRRNRPATLNRACHLAARSGSRLACAVLHLERAFWLLDPIGLWRNPDCSRNRDSDFAVRSFRRAGTNVEPWKPALMLVTTGIFAWLRNPMYFALVLLLAGIAIAIGSDWMLVLVVPAALILHFGVVKREERYLAGKFGESYRSYMDKVPRYWL